MVPVGRSLRGTPEGFAKERDGAVGQGDPKEGGRGRGAGHRAKQRAFVREAAKRRFFNGRAIKGGREKKARH